MASASSYLIVARIVAPFGIKGELKADLLTDFPEHLADRSTVLLGREGEVPRSFAIRGLRFHKNQALLTLAGCADRNAAEAMRGLYVYVPEHEAARLPAGAYYLHQIIGLEVWGTDGQLWGKVASILKTGSNDVYVVSAERGEILLPAVPAYVREVDLAHGRIVAEMAGL